VHKVALFVFGQPGPWAHYRCDHQAEQLGLLGIPAEVAHADGVDLVGAADDYQCIVLNRVAWNDDVAAFVARARSSDRTVLFDTDDLVFESSMAEHFAFLDGWPAASRKAQLERFDCQRRTLEACDGALVSTRPLAGYASRRINRVGVVHNAVSGKMVRLADEALRGSRRGGDDDVTIAYLSGTGTHDRDFLEAADAVLWALETYREVRLLVVGKLQLDARFASFGSRVERLPLQPWESLPDLLFARIDINLAPLERMNPVTESKSCVKYLEAGLVGVPTVASARNDFVRVIVDGENGLLADEASEWREALRRLIESPSLRRAVGTRARDDVRTNHTTNARAGLLVETLSKLTDRRFDMSSV
jgi:glycosyltransferase involved in cell wall biosynthesis